MFCKFCGAEISNDAAFCAKCGKAVEAIAPVPEAEEKLMPTPPERNAPPPPPPPPPPKPKGLVAPIIILLIAVSGWLYILSSNSIEGMIAWFTSSNDLQTSVSQQYNYFGNNFSAQELAGNIALLVIMVLFTVLAIIGVIMLIKRLIRKFSPKKSRPPKRPE
jgi:hypothetical protein